MENRAKSSVEFWSGRRFGSVVKRIAKLNRLKRILVSLAWTEGGS